VITEKEVIAIEKLIKKLEKEKEQKMAGEELILKNLEDWAVFKEETGELNQRDLDALKEAQDSFLINRKK
jgi:hypothetical protein